MGMTIEEHIAQLVRVKHYAAPIHYETLNAAIDTMRKYQKIEEILAMDDENHRRTIKLSELREILEK